MTCGIYKITNIITNKSYIGRSIHIEQRWKEHIRGHGNKQLSLDINNLGLKNFTFEILEKCNKKDLVKKEEEWIKKYDSYKNGYNLNSGGDNIEQSVQKTQKKIFCYDLDGTFLKEYISLSEAERQTGINNSNISRAAKTKGRTKNFQWRYNYQEKIEPYKRKTASYKNNPTISKEVF